MWKGTGGNKRCIVYRVCPDDIAGGLLSRYNNPPTTTETYPMLLTGKQSIQQSRRIYESLSTTTPHYCKIGKTYL